MKYSCANIYNTRNSPITEWSMKMFGVIPINPAMAPVAHIQAGWSPPALVGGAINAQRIIQFDFASFFQNTLLQNLIQLGNAINAYNMGAHHAILMPNIGGINLNALGIAQLNGQTQANIQALITALQNDNHLRQGTRTNPALRLAYSNVMNGLRLNNMLMRVPPALLPAPTIANLRAALLNLFVNDFRLTASSSVGRVLLYRLLIEIRRHQPGNNNGTLANDAIGLDIGVKHNYNRSVTIVCGSFAFRSGYFSLAVGGHPARIVNPCIHFNNTRCNLCTIGGNSENEDIIRLGSVNSHVALFHEIIHWYHLLRAPDRADFFVAADANLSTRRNNFLWLTYWGPLQTEGRKLFSESQWRSSNNQFFNQEEVLTILGAPSSAKNIIYSPMFHRIAFRGRKCYLEGYDLSENLYRAYWGMALRFGYQAIPFTENSMVIKNVTR